MQKPNFSRNQFACILTAVFLLAALSCKKKMPDPDVAREELIFHSGFEPNSAGIPDSAHQDITGVDQSVNAPNDWSLHLDANKYIGTFSIQYQGGTDSDRYARIIPDPVDSSNHVLKYWLKYPRVPDKNTGYFKGRIQANLYDNIDLYEVYIKVRVKLHPDFTIVENAPAPVTWLTVQEFWNNKNWGTYKNAFRISINLQKPENDPGHPLHFDVHAQTYDNKKFQTVWEEYNGSFDIPLDEWMTWETYFKEGDAKNGRFYFAVTRANGLKTVIFDVHNVTHHPKDRYPDGLSHFNPMKLYTSGALVDYVREQGGVLQIYWDDFELWRNHKP